ncbi:MAG: hypothetical protein V2I33_19245, partial [Kangiellaceae bacterium]|nr:hypothetical protein [Kangiellaceae bacterium]
MAINKKQNATSSSAACQQTSSFAYDTSMASRLGDLDLSQPDRALTWIKAFKALARAKKWSDGNDNKEIADNFMAACGLEALDKITHLLAPRSLDNLPFADIETALTAHLQPQKRLTIAERTRFYGLRQLDDELISDFLARLRKAATHCDFDSLKLADSPQTEMLRVALVAGLRCHQQQRRVLEAMQDKIMTVTEIVDFVRSLEQVSTFVSSRAQTKSAIPPQECPAAGDNAAAIHHQQSKRAGQHQRACKYCGRSHAKGQCPAYGKTCNSCSKRNRFASVCQSATRAQTSGKVHHHSCSGDSSEESVDKDDTVLHISDNDGINAVSDSHEIIVINDIQLPMQVDTGASVSVLS